MPKIKATYTTTSNIDFDLDIDIFLLNSRVFSAMDSESKNKTTVLTISIETELDDFESFSECAMYARPRLLIILGILSFLTQRVFTPFEFNNVSSNRKELSETISTKFNYESANHLPFLKEILKYLASNNESKTRLFYSLIDRFRKALFLENESEDNMIHDDEILLSYFHIIELLSSAYSSNQKKTAREEISIFAESVLKNVYLIEGNQLKEELNAKRKLIESIFKPTLSVGSKIMYMLKQQGILTNRLKAFVSDLVKDRNSVAHGRQVYQDKVIFPVPPFFPLIRNRDYSMEMLRFLSGRAISLFIGIGHLKTEWDEIGESLFPTLEELNGFLNAKKHETISVDNFYSGTENDITPFTVTYYLLHKKISTTIAIQLLSNVILNYREIEDEITQIVISIILIIDSTENELKEKCIEIIKLSSKNSWIPDFKMRDILYYLEFLGHKPMTLREMIKNKEIR